MTKHDLPLMNRILYFDILKLKFYLFLMTVGYLPKDKCRSNYLIIHNSTESKKHETKNVSVNALDIPFLTPKHHYET